MIALLAALACSEAPAPLPASALPDHAPPVARMVRAGAVTGYLARPADAPAPLPGALVLVEVIDEAGRAAARARADAGAVVLLVAPGVDPSAAEAYLAGLPTTGAVSVVCERADCR